MRIRAARMIEDVRIAMDMNGSERALQELGDTTSLRIEDIIRKKLSWGARAVELEAPLELLGEGHHLRGGIIREGNGRGFMLLPNDFLRLISFRMSDWERTVYEAVDCSDRRYGYQSSRFAGIRGNRERPVVAIVKRSEGLGLEIYNCDGELERGTYQPKPEIDEEGIIDIAEGCYEASVLRVASLVLSTLREENWKEMYEQSLAMLEVR